MHYVIGDVQGCYDELRHLLDKLCFDYSKDKITFAGDLLNRGLKSKSVLKFIIENQNCMDTVLGNHDLHFLSIYGGVRNAGQKDTLAPLLKYKKVDIIVDWLLKKPLCVEINKTLLVCHAGLYPLWTPKKALAYSNTVSEVLQSKNWKTFLKNVYGNSPNRWEPNDRKINQLRFIVNAFTRMRYVNSQCHLNFSHKGPIEVDSTKMLIPWFNYQPTKNKTHTVLFGHWSALGAAKRPMSISLDGGCIWGGKLCAVNTKSLKITSVKSKNA